MRTIHEKERVVRIGRVIIQKCLHTLHERILFVGGQIIEFNFRGRYSMGGLVVTPHVAVDPAA